MSKKKVTTTTPEAQVSDDTSPEQPAEVIHLDAWRRAARVRKARATRKAARQGGWS